MADLSILSQLQGMRRKGLVVDIGVNSRAAAGDRAGSIGDQCAVFGGSNGCTIKGIAKNMNRFHILFACSNLVMCIRANRSLAPIAG